MALPGWKAGRVRGAPISHQEEETLSYLIGSAAPVAILALVAIAEAQTMQNGSEPRAATVEVVMKDKAFQIIQGEQAVSPRGFVLLSGTHGDIRLRNEDTVAHEFVSPMLYKVPFQVSGTGTFVEAPKAAGVRVGPGQTVVLSLDVPWNTKGSQDFYEVFWCNVHGKQHGDKMRGEVLIVDRRCGIGCE